MKKYLIVATLCFTSSGFLVAQDRPSLTAPVLQTNPDTIVFTTRFMDFASGSGHRFGVGSPDGEIQGAEFELTKGGTALSKDLVTFRQAYANAYFEVDEIVVTGYVFSSDELPGEGEELSLKVTVPRPEAERLKRLFIIISQQFGPERWYIMDGAELNESHW